VTVTNITNTSQFIWDCSVKRQTFTKWGR